MLRRYNSKNLDTILLKNRRTTIGSAQTCDVVLKGKGIAPVHASIESNSSGYFLKEHSLSGMTRVNDRPVFGQVEIHSGDLIQVGGAPPFVFDSEWMFGTRPNSAKLMGKEATVHPTPDPNQLPMITGKKIHPISQQQSFSDSSVKKRSNFAKLGKTESGSGPNSLRSSASSTESQNRTFFSNNRSIGNNLLQRVVKLQAELIAKDEKIRQLTSHPLSSSLLYYHPAQAPPILAPPLHQLPAPPPLNTNFRSKPTKSFELFAYRAFVGAITSQLRQFNDRVLRHPQRDSAELFNAMCRAVDIPLSSRIGEIEKYCEAVLIDNDFEDGDELMQRLDDFIRESRREKILELTNELEVLMPLIRDAASNARENIKVCNVFTQWSRQFGDLLRKNSFSATTLFQAIEDLKTQFSDAHMSRHWLPPSITPILRLAALELEKRNGDVTPSASPPPPPAAALIRKNSIDMTLDTCISQVETILHEMDYHLLRLYNKAKDYSTFQPLDLDTVTRISKIVDSMKSNVELLNEHSFKEDRPNSVLFFEITNDDLKNSIKKSDGEGSSGSLSSMKKVSVAPKNPEIFSEDEEILEERREVESDILKIIGKISEKIGLDGEEPQRNQGMISLDATVLKTLIQQSQRLLSSYDVTKSDDSIRRKRSAPPIILVHSDGENEDVVQEIQPIKAEKVENSENVTSSENAPEGLESENPENSAPEPPICAKPAQNHEVMSETSETPEDQVPDEHSENVTSSENAPEDVEPENPENFAPEPPICAKPAQNPEKKASEAPEDQNPEHSENSEKVTSSENSPEDQESGNSESFSPTSSENAPEATESEVPPIDLTSSEDPTTPEVTTPRDSETVKESEILTAFEALESQNPENAPEDPPESPHSSEGSEISESPESENSDPEDDPTSSEAPPEASYAFAEKMSSEKDEEGPKAPEPSPRGPEDVKLEDVFPEDVKLEDVEPINDDSESEDEKSTIRYIPSEATPPELTPQDSEESLQKSSEDSEELEDVNPSPPPSNGAVLRETRSEDQISSHLKSHINTANGKPHITYQYPVHSYFSPPMKRRSKSEDQKIKDTLRNRPPFVLY